MTTGSKINIMNETEKAFKQELEALLKRYNATIYVTDNQEIEVDCNPEGDCIPCATFALKN